MGCSASFSQPSTAMTCIAESSAPKQASAFATGTQITTKDALGAQSASNQEDQIDDAASDIENKEEQNIQPIQPRYSNNPESLETQLKTLTEILKTQATELASLTPKTRALTAHVNTRYRKLRKQNWVLAQEMAEVKEKVASFDFVCGNLEELRRREFMFADRLEGVEARRRYDQLFLGGFFGGG